MVKNWGYPEWVREIREGENRKDCFTLRFQTNRKVCNHSVVGNGFSVLYFSCGMLEMVNKIISSQPKIEPWDQVISGFQLFGLRFVRIYFGSDSQSLWGAVEVVELI